MVEKKVNIAWRRQEIIFVSIVFLMALTGYMWESLTITDDQIRQNYRMVFAQHAVPFNYNLNIFLPGTGALILLYGLYVLVNFRVAPVMKIYEDKSLVKVFYNLLISLSLFAAASLLVALGISIANDYAHPWLFNYGGFHALAFFGYRPNLAVAFSHAFLMTGSYAIYAYIREALIWTLERRGSKNSYRILVANQVTAILFIYMLVVWITRYFDFNINIAGDIFPVVTPVLLFSLANIYWLFPEMKEGARIFAIRTVIRLLVSGFFCSLPFLFFPVSDKKWLIFLLYWIAVVCFVTPISWFIYRYRKDRILQLRSMQQKLVRTETNLQFLRTQINPHFLFNVLNTLYGTALQEGGIRTAEGIQRLGDMMRFMLHENSRDFIPMKSEIEYLGNYITLQKLRVQTSPGIQITVNIDGADCNHHIAPMILIPFVENAFKHGISLSEPSWIRIDLRCTTADIHFTVSNSIQAQQRISEEDERTGIGISNVVERLKLIYPRRHVLTCKNEGNTWLADLIIQF